MICDPAFAGVQEEFERNLAERGDIGAAVVVAVGGEVVVDLWGGWLDDARTRPWTEDSLCPIMSGTKGPTSLCAHLLLIDGTLDLDALVGDYWPEYACNGKEATRVRHVLTHQAGLPALRDPLPEGAMYDFDGMVERLAVEPAFWEPGSAYGYHALTYGYLVGELVRRITGVGIDDFFATEVAEPLGLDLWMGVPEEHLPRVSSLFPPPFPEPGEPISKYTELVMTEPESAASLLTLNTGGYLAPGGWDSPTALMSVMPSVGGVGNARSLSAMYRAIVHDRKVGRFTIDDGALAAMTTSQSRLSRDCVLHAPAHWSLGFQKGGCAPADVQPAQRVALGPDAFGHTGMGGSISFADPSCDLAFAYTMNQMALDMGLGPTGESLVDATYRALGYRQTARRDLWFRPTAT